MFNMKALTIAEAINKHNNDYSNLENKFTKKYGFSINLDPFHPPIWARKSIVKSISVVIPSYNSSNSIVTCLYAIEKSSFNYKFPEKLEVIVVDDGSTDNTWDKLISQNYNLNLMLIKQKNYGQAQALNTGISKAKGEIIVSCDSDMILSYYTLEHFSLRHSECPNALFAGFRHDTHVSDVRVDENYIKRNGPHRYPIFIADERLNFPHKDFYSSMCISTNHYKDFRNGKKLYMPNNKEWLLPDLVFGALFSLSKNVFTQIGGYDERFKGWGCTDGFLAAKAISTGSFIIPLYCASGLHIHHKDRSNKKNSEFQNNRKKFYRFIKNDKTSHYRDYLKHAYRRIEEIKLIKHGKNNANKAANKHRALGENILKYN